MGNPFVNTKLAWDLAPWVSVGGVSDLRDELFEIGRFDSND